jgi:hypothetical protein
MNDIEMPLESIRQVIDYMHDDERKNWEENGKPPVHIFMDLLDVEQYMAGDEHFAFPCFRDECDNDATRFYEDPKTHNGTAYVCTDHEDVEKAETSDDGMITNSKGKKVELGVYSCGDDCGFCNS